MLSEIFANVDCLTLPIPGNTKAALQNLGSTSNKNPAWISALNDVRTKILTTKSGRVSNGLEFLKATKALVRSIQQVNSFPEVPSVWEALLSAQNETAIKEAEEVFDLIMNKRINATNPLTEDEFDSLYTETMTFSIKVLKKYLFDVKSLYTQCTNKLKDILLAKRTELLKRNNKNLKEFCKYAKSDVYTKVSQRINQIQLPMTREKLVEKMAASEVILSSLVYDKFNNVCMSYIDDLRGEVEELKRSRLESNSQKITQYLNTIAEKSIHMYSSGFEDEIKKTFTPKNAATFLSTEFNTIDSRLSDSAIKYFSKNAEEYSTEVEYDIKLTQIKSEMETIKEGKLEEIKKTIERSIKSIFDEVYIHFKNMAEEVAVSLPLTDEELENEFRNIKNTCQNEILEKLSFTSEEEKDVYYTEQLNNVKREFSASVNKYWNNYIVTENKSQYEAHAAEPFRLALKDVEAKCKNIKNKIEFESCVRGVVKKRLQHTFSQSKELSDKAVEDFLAKSEVRQMAPEDMDFSIIATFIIGAIAIFIMVLFMRS